MSAQIVIDDGTNPPVIGSVNQPVSFRSVLHTLSNFDDTNVLARLWALADKPTTSSAVLSSSSNPTTGLTPDIEGGYLVRLTTYLDAGATVIDAIDEQVVRIRFELPFNWGLPAAGETTQLNTARGWADPRNSAIRQTRRNLLSAPIAAPITLAAATTTTLTRGGLILYDPSSSSGTHTIRAPASPALGDRWSLKNVSVSIISVAIDGNGNSIEDPNTSTLLASFALAAAFASFDFLFDGTNWIIL